MTRVLHTGDTHLGYQQYHLPARREDFLAAFRQVVTDAIADDVDAVVHAGDLFHDRRPTLSDVMGALSVLRQLDDADIPFLAVVGNHESKRDAQWLDLFEDMGLATRLDNEPVTIGGTAFYGLDFVPRSRRDDLDYNFEPHDSEYAALVSHGLFEPFQYGDWDAQEILSKADVEFDVMLFGDDHEPKTKQVDSPHEAWLTYCGSTERASGSEREQRGYNIAVFEDGVDIRRRGLATREFQFVDVELGEGEGIERIRERIGEYDVTDAVVLVSVSGDGEHVLPATVEEFGDERGALVTRVTDHRELAEETDIEVSFADPDDAVREEIQEMGLSAAARDIDETIRESKVADSNIADTVERHVREFAENADAGAFTPAEDASSSQDSESTVDTADTPEDETGSKGEEDQVTMEDYL